MQSTVVLGDYALTQTQIETRAACAAAGFRALGVRPGDAIAVMLSVAQPAEEVADSEDDRVASKSRRKKRGTRRTSVARCTGNSSWT